MKISEDKQMKHDKFCWRCCGEGTTLKCSACVRSFHTNCAPNGDTDGVEPGNWLCSVCVSLREAENVDKKSDLEMLPILIEKAIKDKSFHTLQHPLKGASNESIVNPIDLTKIKENIDSYTSFDHFLADIQWIVHNCFILILESHEQMDIARSLVDYFEEEIEMVKKCAECYSNADKHPNTWFTMTCNELHLVVWAKKMGFNYWPAKMMAIDGQLINVRFFGDHKYADVPATNCFLYSDTNPNKSRNTTVSYKSALKEADVYIKNCRQKFGSYNLVEAKTAFNPAQLGKYIVQVVPELAGSQMVKSLKAKMKKPEQSSRKSSTTTKLNPKPKPHTEETEPINRKSVSMVPISPRKNVVIALARIDQNTDENVSKAKRTNSVLNGKDQPPEKKAKLTNDATENSVCPEKKADNPVVVIPNDTQPNVLPNEELNNSVDTKSETKTSNETSVNENVVVSSAEAKESNGQEEATKQMLNSTEIECKVDDSMRMNQSSISELSFISGYSVEEPTSTATIDDLDWEHSFNKDINDTVKAASVTVCSMLENKLKSKFEMLKNKLQAVTLERDQVTLGAERAKVKAKEDHAKEIADINEKYVQAIAKAKKDAESIWMAKLEEQQVKADTDLNEVNRVMMEKVADAEMNLANANIVHEEQRKEQEQAMAKLQEQHKIEMESEKQRTTTEMEQMKKEHADKVTELEGKIKEAIDAKADVESQLEVKYRDIVAGIRQKAEIERKERMSCACCSKPLEIKRVCSTQCEQMWGIWKSPNASDKTLK